MNNKTWKLEVISREGVVVESTTKIWVSLAAAMHARNKKQRSQDYNYPDLGFHVRVVEVRHLPSYPTKRFHVYSDVGVYVGTFTEALAFAKAQEIDGTLVEAI